MAPKESSSPPRRIDPSQAAKKPSSSSSDRLDLNPEATSAGYCSDSAVAARDCQSIPSVAQQQQQQQRAGGRPANRATSATLTKAMAARGLGLNPRGGGGGPVGQEQSPTAQQQQREQAGGRPANRATSATLTKAMAAQGLGLNPRGGGGGGGPVVGKEQSSTAQQQQEPANPPASSGRSLRRSPAVNANRSPFGSGSGAGASPRGGGSERFPPIRGGGDAAVDLSATARRLLRSPAVTRASSDAAVAAERRGGSKEPLSTAYGDSDKSMSSDGSPERIVSRAEKYPVVKRDEVAQRMVNQARRREG